MVQFLSAWLACALILIPIDFVWLALAGPRLYRPALGAMLRDHAALAPAAAFYILYTAGLAFFAATPAAPTRALVVGGFFGLIAYATYDLSNWATLRGWPAHVALTDMAWGAAASGVAACLAALIVRALSPAG